MKKIRQVLCTCPEDTYKIEIFACVSTDAYDSVFYSQETQTTDDLPEFISYIKKQSVNWRDIDLQNGDRVIGLSTCADTTTNGRHILFGKLVKEKFIKQGEETEE